MCGGVETVVLEEQGQDVHLMDGGGSAISLTPVTAGVGMLFVMAAGLAAFQLVRSKQQLSYDVERGAPLRSQPEQEDTEDEQMHVE